VCGLDGDNDYSRYGDNDYWPFPLGSSASALHTPGGGDVAFVASSRETDTAKRTPGAPIPQVGTHPHAGTSDGVVNGACGQDSLMSGSALGPALKQHAHARSHRDGLPAPKALEEGAGRAVKHAGNKSKRAHTAAPLKMSMPPHVKEEWHGAQLGRDDALASGGAGGSGGGAHGTTEAKRESGLFVAHLLVTAIADGQMLRDSTPKVQSVLEQVPSQLPPPLPPPSPPPFFFSLLSKKCWCAGVGRCAGAAKGFKGAEHYGAG
jgi:hypothetical protein